MVDIYDLLKNMRIKFMSTRLYNLLTHWGRVTHICVGKLIIIGSDNGLSPGRRQAIIWTSAGIWLMGPLGTNISEILIKIHIFSFKKFHLKLSSAKWRPFCLGLIVVNTHNGNPHSLPMRLRYRMFFYEFKLYLCSMMVAFGALYAIYARNNNALTRSEYIIFYPDSCTHNRVTSLLTHLPLDKMAAISQTIFWNAFPWMKSLVFWLKFHWNLFLRGQLTITKHWIR